MKPMPVFSKNKKARRDYRLLDTYLAGVVLDGQEVKSIRNGGSRLTGSYITIKDGEAWLLNSHISRYEFASENIGYEPTRTRKLLITKKEIASLEKSKQNKMTIVPIAFVSKGPFIKLAFATARGKKAHDKRYDIKLRDTQRDINRAVKTKKR